ncbi:MAG: NfeD family protein [Cyanobacteria bacterium]|nr:NfeD family protein [Cyanobacteriota bacterium]MDW8202752.1 NfeD family protein [Cyanobacteriota bacterium SKYGB_h_bin112]
MFEREIEWFAQRLTGRVEMEVTPYQLGRVQFQGTSWFARLNDPSYYDVIRAGEVVLVLGREGSTTLIVMPIDISVQASDNDHTQDNHRPTRNGWWQWLAS